MEPLRSSGFPKFVHLAKRWQWERSMVRSAAKDLKEKNLRFSEMVSLPSISPRQSFSRDMQVEVSVSVVN